MSGDGAGTGAGAGVETRGRTQDGNGDKSGGGNESSSGDGNGNEDGIEEGAGKAKKCKKSYKSWTCDKTGETWVGREKNVDKKGLV